MRAKSPQRESAPARKPAAEAPVPSAGRAPAAQSAQADTLLAAIVESSNDAIYSVALDGLITSWNEGAERLYGYTPAEAIGLPKVLTVPPDRMSELAHLDQRAKSGIRVDHIETVRIAKDGRRVDVSLSVSPVHDAGGEIVSIAFIARDVSDRKRLELQRAMMAELNHRVKNSLAIVGALARRTLRNSQSPEGFVNAFESRLKAFGRTHNALTTENWIGIELRHLLLAELSPYKGEHYERTKVSGPGVLLRPNAALAFGMTVHELASNAVKFGALSSTGRVAITWQVTPESPHPLLTLTWVESGGPAVKEPTRTGLGRRLIAEMLQYEFGAKVTLAFEPAGVQCRIEMPLTHDSGSLAAEPELPERAP
ncbi:MAG TPA: HWE histidine kinase domain-containing protein [Methylomirabilota bacterium]|nr:HWE histidine kinase domain-containing protein [Methylomirabilota bacterium]